MHFPRRSMLLGQPAMNGLPVISPNAVQVAAEVGIF